MMQYEYVDESTIDSDLICAICSEPFVDPSCTPCGDTFCRQCITNWLATGNSSCPLCRQTLNVRRLTESPRTIRNILAQIPVKCLRCQQTNISRGDFNDHIGAGCPKYSSKQNVTQKIPLTNDSTVDYQDNPLSKFVRRRISPYCNRQNIWKFLLDFVICTFVIALSIFIVVLLFSVGQVTLTRSSTRLQNYFNQEALAKPIICRLTDQRLEPTLPFESSNLLSYEYQHCLNFFYGSPSRDIIGWKLIYRGSFHGFTSKSFHRYCDKVGETFIVLSTSQGHLFGGFTDVNWMTPEDNIPHYNRSDRAFLFSLKSPMNNFPTKFLLNSRYKEFAIVNDPSSGPIFGGMTRPDIGLYSTNERFRCQIHFPTVYQSAIAVSSFPTSEDCIIEDIEVFTANTTKSSYVLSLIVGLLVFMTFFATLVIYDSVNKRKARRLFIFFLFGVGIHYYLGRVPDISWACLIAFIFDWIYAVTNDNNDQILWEKRVLLGSSLVILFIK